MKRTLTFILTLALALSCLTAAAFATNAVPGQQGENERPSMPQGGPGNGNMASPQQPADAQQNGGVEQELQILVEKGIISQETLDAILKYVEENRPELPDGAPNQQNGEQLGSMPQTPDGNQPGNPPEKPEGNDFSNAPEKPNGETPPSSPDGSNSQVPADGIPHSMLSRELLDDLLEASIITQEEYDAIFSYQQTSEAADASLEE